MKAVIANDDSIRATQDGGDTPEALKHDIDRLAEINAELLADLSEALRLLRDILGRCKSGNSPFTGAIRSLNPAIDGHILEQARQFLESK